MTLIVGILCSDGVVMASDSAATMGAVGIQTIGQQWIRKLTRLDSRTLMAATGAVGIAQVIGDMILRKSGAGQLGGQKTPEQIMQEVGVDIANSVRPYLDTAHIQKAVVGDASASLCKTMVAIPVRRSPCLFTFDFNGAPEKATPDLPFVSMGSGQMIADPFLAFLKRAFWKESQPTVAEGRLVAVWTIDHVCQTNPGGVGGDIQLATLVGDDARIVGEEEVQEHKQRAAIAERALVQSIRGTDGAEVAVPDVPRAG